MSDDEREKYSVLDLTYIALLVLHSRALVQISLTVLYDRPQTFAIAVYDANCDDTFVGFRDLNRISSTVSIKELILRLSYFCLVIVLRYIDILALIKKADIGMDDRESYVGET